MGVLIEINMDILYGRGAKMKLTKLYIDQDTYEEFTETFKSKVTILLGSNGAGKTTLLKAIEHELKRDYCVVNKTVDRDIMKNTPYSLQLDGGHIARSFTSEGEKMSYMTSLIISELGYRVRRQDKDVIFCLDELDSGLTYDNIIANTDFIKDTLMKETKIKKMFITANSYELASQFIGVADFYWIESKEFIKFNSYEEFIKLYERRD